MSAYYPTQASSYAGVAQPVVYSTSSHHGHGYAPQYASSAAYYGQPGLDAPVVVVPSSHHSHHSHRSHRHHGHHHHSPDVVGTAAAPIVVQPSYSGDYGYDHHHDHYRLSFGERIRRFFGLAPRGPFKYRYNRGMWGFLGYSRRQRYSDARTGAEVDRKGRPIYRV